MYAIESRSLSQKKQKTGKPRSKSTLASISLLLIRKTQKHWTNESMASILEAIRNVLCAAVMYNIPRQILYDRVKGYVTHGSLLGSGYYLSNCEENELAE